MAVYCSILQQIAVYGSILQYIAVYCSTSQYIAFSRGHRSKLIWSCYYYYTSNLCSNIWVMIATDQAIIDRIYQRIFIQRRIWRKRIFNIIWVKFDRIGPGLTWTKQTKNEKLWKNLKGNFFIKSDVWFLWPQKTTIYMIKWRNNDNCRGEEGVLTFMFEWHGQYGTPCDNIEFMARMHSTYDANNQQFWEKNVLEKNLWNNDSLTSKFHSRCKNWLVLKLPHNYLLLVTQHVDVWS